MVSGKVFEYFFRAFVRKKESTRAFEMLILWPYSLTSDNKCRFCLYSVSSFLPSAICATLFFPRKNLHVLHLSLLARGEISLYLPERSGEHVAIVEHEAISKFVAGFVYFRDIELLLFLSSLLHFRQVNYLIADSALPVLFLLFFGIFLR